MKLYLITVITLLTICSCSTDESEPTTEIVIPETNWVDQDLNGDETGQDQNEENDNGDID